MTKYLASLQKSQPEKKASADFGTRDAIAIHNYLTKFVMPACTAMTDRKDPEKDITSIVVLADATHLTLTRVWQLRSLIQNIAQLLATCYQEILHRVYIRSGLPRLEGVSIGKIHLLIPRRRQILNTPPFFGAIWTLLKRWLDTNTMNKLVLVPCKDVLSTLASIIDLANIPSQYGGELEFEHGMLPNLDQAFYDAWTPGELNTDNELPPGPIKVAAVDGKRVLVATGTINGQNREKLIRCIGTWTNGFLM